MCAMKQRMHKTDQIHKNSFTARYNLVYLVYYENYTWIQEAIHSEKEIKKNELNQNTESKFCFFEFNVLF